MERTRHIVAGVAAVVALVAAVAVVLGRSSVPGGAAALLSSNTWAWGDQPMSMDPMAAATQAASLASVAKQGYMAEQHKLATLRMVQVGQMSGALQEEAAKSHAQQSHALAASKAFNPVPFSSEVAQRLQAVNGAAENAQAAASHALGNDVLKLWAPYKGSYIKDSHMSSHMVALPSRTTRNGLALDYFHLDTLPAATAVRFAKREVVGAMAKPAPPSPGLLSVDQMAKKAFEQGTEIVVSRRQKAGILPMPINKGWNYSLKKVKEQVGEKVVKAQKAVAKVDYEAKKRSSKMVAGHAAAAPAAVQPAAAAKPSSVPASRAASVASTAIAAIAEAAKSTDTQGKLGKLEAEVKRLKQEKKMEEQLNSLKAKEATLETKYPQLNRSAGK